MLCRLCRIVSQEHMVLRLSRQTSISYSNSKAAQPQDETSLNKTEDSTSRAVAEKTKPRTNKPFIKDLFLGRFDTDMLVFPELETSQEVEELEHLAKPLQRFFTDSIDSAAIDRDEAIPAEVLDQLKGMGLFGVQIPTEYGGLGLSAMQVTRLNEVTALDSSVAVTLHGHNVLGVQGLLLFGTEEQKRKYLPRLASGEVTMAFTLTEPSSGSDAASIQSRAEEGGEGYVVNGEKIWITNGGTADLFIVFAKTAARDPTTGEKGERLTAFLVERGFGGVTSGPPERKMGLRGSNTCAVHFDNTPVPKENVLGDVGGGFKVAMNILNSGRFGMGAGCASILKLLIGKVAEHVSSRKQFGKTLSEFELIKEKIARLSVAAYAMESMSYMTAGTIDAYREPDTSLEAAIVKLYSSEACWAGVSECIQLVGGAGFMRDLPYERYLRDLRIFSIFEGTNEILRLLISLTSIQHAGSALQSTVRKLRNPLENPGFAVRMMARRYRENLDDPKLTLHLAEHLHPTLALAAMHLEQRVQKLRIVVERLLGEYGKGIAEEQLVLSRLADVTVDLYGMTACLARASRSLAIGLRNCEHESLLAQTFVYDAGKRIDAHVAWLNTDKTQTNADSYIKIADGVFKHNAYVPVHPLTRNW